MINPPDALVKLLEEKEFPRQRAFTFSPERWDRWLGHIKGMPEFLSALPPRLDRIAAAETVEASFRDFPAGGFVASMIWGHGKTGYGPYRTAYILTGSRIRRGASLVSENVEHLVEATQRARDSGAAHGYRYLNNRPGKISGLGPAFFTKWLYFSTTENGGNTERTAPVLDQLILHWMATSASMRLKPARSNEYERYVDILRQWGAPYGLTPADVEERIFRLIRNDGA